MTPTVIVVGADKGGVGKTTVSRALLDYLKLNNLNVRAFDTESPTGSLKRFFPSAEVVDLTTSDGQMKVFDTLHQSDVTLIDGRAGLLTPMLSTLSDIGFLEASKQGTLKLIALHIVGAATTSLDEVAPIMAALQGSRHIVVANRINDTDFSAPPGSLEIPKLDERASEAVDKAAMPFSAFADSSQSLVLRGYVKHWLKNVFNQFDLARLNAL